MALYQETEPPIVSRLWSTLSTMRGLITGSINAAGIMDPIEVLVGYPTWTEGSKVWAQALDPGFVTVDALPDVRVVTRYRPEWGAVGVIGPAFGYTGGSASSATFTSVSGPPVAGTNVHAIVRSTLGVVRDGQYTTLSGDTPTTVAAAVASAINALSLSGLTAATVGPVLTITGGTIQYLNFGGTGQAHKEVGRVSRTVQVSIWTNSPWSRYAIHDAITSTLGAVDNCWLTLPDGGRVLVLAKGERANDQSQSSYNIYYFHLMYNVEYGVVQRATAAQIGAIPTTLILENEQNQIEQTQNLIIG